VSDPPRLWGDGPAPYRVPLGPFVLHAPVGRGSMGSVWQGVHSERRVPVAVKVMSAAALAEPVALEGFRTEVRAIARLRHPGIVRIFDQGRIDATARRAAGGRLEEGSPYLAMELATGGILPRRYDDWPSLRDALGQILDALGHAHARGIVHRDLKPANVLRCDGRLKLTDFGAARGVHDPVDAGLQGVVVGTYLYMPPEQVEARPRDQGPWTDLYAVGALGWRLSTGRHAFEAESTEDVIFGHLYHDPPKYRPRLAVAIGFEGWLRRLLQKDPADRFRRAAEARSALDALDEGWSRASDRVGPPPLPALPEEPAQVAEHALDGVAMHGLRIPPLVGRRAEQELLWARLREVGESRSPRAVLVRGEVGRGKSRLVQWLEEESYEAGATKILKARHEATGGLGHGLAPLAADFLGTTGLSRKGARYRIHEFLPVLSLPPEETNAYLELAHPRTDIERLAGEPGVEFSSPSERWTLARRLVASAGERRAVLLVLEDVQWGADSLGLALELLEHAELPVLIVVTTRPVDAGLVAERLEALEAHPSTSTCTLDVLGSAAMTRLARDHLRLGERLCVEVLRRAAGNPMYAVRTVDDWVARGLLDDGPDGSLGIDPDATLDSAADLRDVWRPSFERILEGRPESEARALGLAACLGVEVNRDEWAAVCAAAAVDPGALLERLLNAGLARSDGPRWRFEHDLARAAAVDPVHAAGDHRLISEVLTERGAPGGRVASHLVEAGDLEAALDTLLEVGRRLLTAGEFHQVRDLAHRRDAIVDRLGADALDLRRVENDLLRLGASRRLSDGVRRRAELERLLARRAEEPLPDPLLAELLWHHGRLVHDEGETGGEADPVQLCEEAVAVAERSGDEAVLGRARYELATMILELGELAYAEALVRSVLPIFDELGMAAEKERAESTLFLALRHQGRGEETYEPLLARVAKAERDGQRMRLASDRNALGELTRERGDLRAAERHYGAAAMLYEALGVSAGAAVMSVNLGFVLLERRRYSEARLKARAAVDALTSQGRGLLATSGESVVFAASAGLQDWAAFDAAYAAITEALPRTGFVDPDLARSARLAGDLAAAAKQTRRARKAWTLAAEQWQALGRMADVLAVERLLGA